MCIYLFFVVLITLYLFMYNRFGTSSLGNYVVFSNRSLDVFKKGSLVFVRKDYDSVKKGDSILFYNIYTLKGNILDGKVMVIDKTNEKEDTIKLDNGRYISSSYVIGKTKNSIEIPLLGYLTIALSSNLGYLFFVILPTTTLFLYQINNIFKKFSFLR